MSFTPLRGSLVRLLVLAVISILYYAVVVLNYSPLLLRGGPATFFSLFVLILFHFLLVMMVWSYLAVVYTDPGGVPLDWKPVIDEETVASKLLIESESHSMTRYCRKCNQLKPPRSHHCSFCGRCILKMDHHSVWVANCIGASNYKFFLLFLFYTFLETNVVALSLLPFLFGFFSDGEIPGTSRNFATTFAALVLNLSFAFCVTAFLIMHVSLVAGNTTTIEAYEEKTAPKWRYDLGRKRNFEQVFGKNRKYWFIPAHTEDMQQMSAFQGLEYPSNQGLEGQDYNL